MEGLSKELTLTNRYWLLLLLSPLLFILITKPSSLALAWNQGRGGMIPALAFTTLEYLILSRILESKLKGLRLLAGLAAMASMLGYLAAMDLLGGRGLLRAWGFALSVQLLDSFIWLWDYLALALYTTLLLLVTFGAKATLRMLAGVLYSVGIAIILGLDAFFPYDTLGPLQAIVPLLLTADVLLIRFFSLGEAQAQSNILILKGDKGSMSLAVYWPSAGVHSIIIYSLVILSFLLKIPMPPARRALYFSLGALATVGINVLRIFLLSAYALLITTDPTSFEEFHAIAGELLFLPWLVAYLLLITALEDKRLGKRVQA